MVVAPILVVNDVPVAIKLPPVNEAYQLIVPALAIAPNVNVPASQRDAEVTETIVGAKLTVAVTAVREEGQPALIAST